MIHKGTVVSGCTIQNLVLLANPDFLVDYLTALLPSRLCSVGDRMIDGCGALCGMRIGREYQLHAQISPQHQFVQYRSPPGIEPGPPQWEAGD